MEAQKEFHFNDAFFIAERLDAIQNALPIPIRVEKEFHSKDNYIIWTKLSAPVVPPAASGGGQVYSMLQQNVPFGSPVIWTAGNELSGVGFVASSISVTNAGIYSFNWVVQLVTTIG